MEETQISVLVGIGVEIDGLDRNRIFLNASYRLHKNQSHQLPGSFDVHLCGEIDQTEKIRQSLMIENPGNGIPDLFHPDLDSTGPLILASIIFMI